MTSFDEWFKEQFDADPKFHPDGPTTKAAWNASLANVTVEQLMPSDEKFVTAMYNDEFSPTDPNEALDWLRTHIETQLNKLKEGKG